jgi:hypothetical protein
MTVSFLVPLVLAIKYVLLVMMISIYMKVCVTRIALMDFSKTTSGMFV